MATVFQRATFTVVVTMFYVVPVSPDQGQAADSGRLQPPPTVACP
jgi:hypothetical protein